RSARCRAADRPVMPAPTMATSQSAWPASGAVAIAGAAVSVHTERMASYGRGGGMVGSGLRRRGEVERRVVREAAQHVGGDARDVVVVAVPGQRGAPGDRTGGEHRAAVQALVEQQVGIAVLGFLAVDGGVVVSSLLGHHVVVARVLLR